MSNCDTLLINGTIYTMDPSQPRASVIALSGGRVVAVGGEDLENLAGPDTRRVDLKGCCVLPGLTDSHVHFASFALNLLKIDLAATDSLQQVLERVAARAAETPAGEWITGRGWDQERWPKRRFPTVADLDPLTSRHPISLTAKSGHALVANSLALQKAGLTASTPDPAGGQIGRDASGNLTGMFFENAMTLIHSVVPKPDAAEVAVALPAAVQRAWQVGVTGIHDVDNLTAFDAYQRLHQQEKLGLRITKYLPVDELDHVLALHLRRGLGDDWLRIGGIKAFTDGALGPQTAAMLAPYDGNPENLGIFTIERERLQDIAQRATAGGLPLAIHAIGDAANRMVLDVLQETEQTATMRHRIEHVQILHPDDVGRLAELGIIASMQPVHATEDAPMADRYWGDRCVTAYAWKSLLDSGTTLAFGSDCPIEDLNPFLGIHAAVTRAGVGGYGGPDGWYPQQCLTVEQAVHAYTQGAAYAVGMEDRLGSLTAGKWGDLVVLDRDIFTGDPAAIAETKVIGTMIAGKWVLNEK